MRTKGFCSALLGCGEIKLIAEKREYAISDIIAIREYRAMRINIVIQIILAC